MKERSRAQDTALKQDTAVPGPAMSEADPMMDMQSSMGNVAMQDMLLGAFPHAGTIQGATGKSVPGTASVDPDLEAREGVKAKTEGTHTTFSGESPSLDEAAHEAAHQYQHAGVINDAGLDPELQAEAIAEQVTGSGAEMKRLFSGEGAKVATAERAYTEISDATQKANKEWEVGSAARVGDMGLTVTTEMMHEAYAEPTLIAGANEILEAKDSGVKIEAGSKKISGKAPDGSGVKTLSEVKPTIKSSTAASGATPNLWTDCGRSSREVMGPTAKDVVPRAIYDDGAGTTHETPTAGNTDGMRDDIFVKGGLGATAAAAKTAYYALSASDKEAFDKKHGINKYAAPGVGEAFVSRRHDDALSAGDDGGFNFHWGGVIMVAGGDRVTFENFAKPGTTYDTKDSNWYFETRGPPTKAGQTFHEQNQGSVGGDVSDENITMATTNADHAVTATRMSTRLLIQQLASTKREEEKTAFTAELKNRNIEIVATSLDGNEWGSDEVWVEVSGGSGAFKSSVVDIDDGKTHTFSVPLRGLMPITGDLAVKVMEDDILFDDTILDYKWSSPYAATVETNSEYKISIDFDR